MKKPDSTARKRPSGERRGGVRALAEVAPKIAGPAFRRFGFAQAAIVSRWAEIVGPEFARFSLPLKLGFPPSKRVGGTLTIQVDGPFALQMTYVQPQIIERVNRFFGYAAVERIALRQGPLPADHAGVRAAPPPLSPADEAALQQATGGIRDTGLGEAIRRLGRLVPPTPSTRRPSGS
ncbi:DUF721 domain-containing protein [Parapedomonas caeni]